MKMDVLRKMEIEQLKTELFQEFYGDPSVHFEWPTGDRPYGYDQMLSGVCLGKLLPTDVVRSLQVLLVASSTLKTWEKEHSPLSPREKNEILKWMHQDFNRLLRKKMGPEWILDWEIKGLDAD